VLIALAGLVLSPVTAKADLVTQVAIASSFDPSFPGCFNFGTASASAACSGAGFTASGFAEAGYGTMKLFAEATRTTGDFAGFQTQSYLRVIEGFTVLHAASGDIFQMQFVLDGDLTVSPFPNSASLGINAGVSQGSGCFTSLQQSYPASAPYRCVMERALDGNAFFSEIQLSANIELRGGLGTGVVDFSHTLEVDRVVVLLPNGNIDPNAIIQTSSGFIYPSGPTDSTVPEPATALGAVAALGLMLARKRRTSGL
jgi:hypothetical protein